MTPGNLQYALIEHGPHSVQQPIIQFSATNRIADRVDSEADFRRA
jgi:hypothetical protein